MSLLLIALQSLGGLLLLVIIQLSWTYFTNPLKSIPGPFFAKFTNFWRFFDTYGGRPELTHQLLHKKHGTVVRLGPNVVSISDPKYLRVIYNTRGDYLKSQFYSVNDNKIGNQIIKNVFSTLSNEWHSTALRPIQKFYKMSAVLSQEPLVDLTILSFFKHLDERFVDTGKACKIDEWMLFFSWDVIGQMTFRRPMGFMDEGRDHSGLLHTAEQALDYFATIGQIPALDHWLAKNPIRPMGPPSFDPAAVFCAQQVIERKQSEPNASRQPDMLDGFLDIQRVNPEAITDNDLISALLVNIVAGADTTASLLRSVVYYVLKNPKVHKRLQEELDSANLATPVPYAAAHTSIYSDAVIRESARIGPGVGLVLERIVPQGGLALSDGKLIPAGTIVGINPWVIHQDKDVYGEDAASFNPDRWLRDVASGETEEDFQVRFSRMKATDLTFGAGNRICLGRNIALIQVYKAITTLFLTYDMSLVDPKKEWHVQNSWFVRQSDIDIKIQRRKATKA
ncbi:Cytochrome P450 monooxygenase [Lachnellula subtilissima]|uniref:Cytochrome P450 monooxygenase n=1 Tax=Lachnellula subtilissima TaxID=602034 RepID=A0A8H8RGS5_9HELO|nr:Cytochrome P450 monooxygenase [Lachnellula subtilissima]